MSTMTRPSERALTGALRTARTSVHWPRPEITEPHQIWAEHFERCYGCTIVPLRRGTKMAVPGIFWSDGVSRLPRWNDDWGYVGGRLVVVDIDTPEAEADLVGRLPPTLTICTGVKNADGWRGWHHVYRSDDPVPTRVGIMPGVDLKGWAPGLNSLVVGPGSLHSSGELYEPITTCDPSPLPAWIRDLAGEFRPAEPISTDDLAEETYPDQLHRLDRLRSVVREAEPGQRNSTLAWALHQLNKDRGYFTLDAYERLRDAAVDAGLDFAEADAVIRRKLAA